MFPEFPDSQANLEQVDPRIQISQPGVRDMQIARFNGPGILPEEMRA